MQKATVVVLCIFVLILAFIYVDQNRKENPSTPDNNSTDTTPHGHSGNPYSPIIIPPILNISIYEDENCTTELGETHGIDWGVMSPGENKSQTIYLKSTGNSDVKPTLYTSDWVFKDYNGTVLPSAYQQYFNLTWDREGVDIQPSEVVNATLTLAVSPLIANVTTFGFNIHFGWEE